MESFFKHELIPPSQRLEMKLNKYIFLYYVATYYSYMHWRRQGRGEHRERPPPRNLKNCCRKMTLFPEALFFATTFPKVAKNSIFLVNLYQNLPNFLKISKQFVFCPNARKVNTWFVEFLSNYAKIMDFSQLS